MAKRVIGHIKVGTDSNQLASTAYFTSSTAADTAAKVASGVDSVTFDNNSLVTGITVRVKFTYGNTASSPTLAVGSSTAKSIAGGTSWADGDIIAFTYDGTSWVGAASASSGGGFTVAEGTVTSA